jgi:hypothetical protein
MDAITPTDTFESGFVAGWFEARGIKGQPTLEQIQAAIAAFARFAAPWRDEDASNEAVLSPVTALLAQRARG